jgi:soluble lytic murein transglycosylase
VALVVLFVIALPGYLLLLYDVLKTTPEEIARRIADADWRAVIEEEAGRSGLDPALVAAVIAVESGGDAHARSGKGAVGLMQLMPATAREMAVRMREPEPTEDDLLTPTVNIRLGTAYLRRQIDLYENLSLALAAYNAGPGNVRRWLEATPADWPAERVLREQAFPETLSYVRRVRAYRDMLVKMESW